MDSPILNKYKPSSENMTDIYLNKDISNEKIENNCCFGCCENLGTCFFSIFVVCSILGNK